MLSPALGAHVSVAGGFVEGVRRGTGLACDALAGQGKVGVDEVAELDGRIVPA